MSTDEFVRFTCDHCGRKLKVKESMKDRPIKCVGCGNPVKPPAPEVNLSWLDAPKVTFEPAPKVEAPIELSPPRIGFFERFEGGLSGLMKGPPARGWMSAIALWFAVFWSLALFGGCVWMAKYPIARFDEQIKAKQMPDAVGLMTAIGFLWAIGAAMWFFPFLGGILISIAARKK